MTRTKLPRPSFHIGSLLRAATFVALSAAAAAQGGDWASLATWSGASNTKDTESFATSKREWRVRWTAKPTKSPSLFQVSVKRADDDRLVATFSAGTDETAGESYVRGVGRFYLGINSLNVAWTVTVEEPSK